MALRESLEDEQKAISNILSGSKKSNHDIKIEEAGKLTKEETRDVGIAGTEHYAYYARSAGCALSITVILFFSFSIFFKMLADWWIGKWGESSKLGGGDFYIEIFLLLCVMTIIFMFLRSVGMGFMSKAAAYQIVKNIVWNIMRRPMSFFDTTPSGVIINRCTSDVGELDYTIPWFLSFFLNIGFNFFGVIILTSIASPITIIFIVIGLALLVGSFKGYLIANMELKRLNQLSISPLVSLASEFIEGSTVIRVYGKGNAMLRKYQKYADYYHSSLMHINRTNVWFRSKIEFMLSVVAVVVIMVFVINSGYR